MDGMTQARSQDGSPGGAPSARAWLELTDEALLSQCEVHVYRASGPGGQKRNKTSSAVRLRHGPTGLIVTAVESRSQHENRSRALRRLRQAIALSQRNRVDPTTGSLPAYAAALARWPGLRINRRAPDYWLIVQHVLDVLFACQAGLAEAARALHLSTGQLVAFLRRDPKLSEQANRLRSAFGRGPLR